MLRRVLVVSLIALGVVACGGSSPTEAPATPTSAPAESVAPSEAPAESVEPAAMTLAAACDAIGVRKSPSTDGALVTRISRGSTIHVVDMVTGDSYAVGNCGTSGDTWYQIDEIDGTSVLSKYGEAFVYSAAGLYK